MLEILANVAKDATYSCGTGNLSFSGIIPYVTSIIVLVIQIAIPVLLVIFGMLDLGKAVIAQKEDDIKKGQGTFLKRLLAAIIVFFVVFVVKMVIGFVSNDDSTISGCLNCFITGDVANDSCKLKAGTAGGM